MSLPLIICLISFSSLFPFTCHAVTDTLTASDTLSNNQTLVSAGGVFELGFFIDSSSGNHYLGIWLRADAKRVVWVAYRDIPILDSSGVLQIRAGNLVVSDRRQLQLIVNSGNVATTTNTSATLLDTGNLLLKDANTGTTFKIFFPNNNCRSIHYIYLGLKSRSSHLFASQSQIICQQLNT